MLTPGDVHHGRAQAVLARRKRTLQTACASRPERFVQGIHKPSPGPEEGRINPPPLAENGGTAQFIATASVSQSLAGSGMLSRYAYELPNTRPDLVMRRSVFTRNQFP